MIFHIVIGALEFGKDERHGFAHHIGQHVQSPPMRHAQDEGMRAQLRGAINRILERRDNGLAAVQPEPLGRVELLRQKVFKRVGKAEALENVLLLLLVVALPAGVFDALPNPIHLVRISNVLSIPVRQRARKKNPKRMREYRMVVPKKKKVSDEFNNQKRDE